MKGSWSCGEAAARSLGVLVDEGGVQDMFLGLWPREKCPPSWELVFSSSGEEWSKTLVV